MCTGFWVSLSVSLLTGYGLTGKWYLDPFIGAFTAFTVDLVCSVLIGADNHLNEHIEMKIIDNGIVDKILQEEE